MDTCNILEYIGMGGDYIIKNIVKLLTSWPFIVLVVFFCAQKILCRNFEKNKRRFASKRQQVFTW